HHIRRRERPPECIAVQRRARKQVWLKHRYHTPPRERLARRREGRLHLGGMMRVVVHHVTPRASPTRSNRRPTPVNAASAARAGSRSTPSSCATASAAAALRTL